MLLGRLIDWKSPRNFDTIHAYHKQVDFLLRGYCVFEFFVLGWLGQEDVLYIPKEARLEVSGLNKEKVGNTVNMRIGQKKRQITSSDKPNLPGWIIVVEFTTPKSKIIKK